MVWILPNMLTLTQYLIDLKGPQFFNNLHCIHCGYTVLWKHGCYGRKADREGGDLNPILIQRFFCTACKKTFSALPECLPPRRWYLWQTQQAALLFHLSGQSLRAIAHGLTPARHTLSRWLKGFQEQFLLQGSVLRSHDPELGRASGFSDFWQLWFQQFSLGTAMRLCHNAGVSIP